jgi:2-methylisocitrate lyase-like PEP mutase family enzyme
VRAARAAVDAAGGDVVFTARSEGFIRGRPDLEETVRRLKAFAAAGADCLYAPGIRTREQIAAVVGAVAPKPVNFLMGAATDLTVADLAGLGVRRISLGGTLARVAWTAITRSAREIAETGSFASLAGTMANAELNRFFADDMKKRPDRR